MGNLNKKLIRPDVKISLSKSDMYWEIIGLLLLIGYWLFLFIIYSSLPESIPSHLDVKGNIDGYSNKTSDWTLPKVATILYALLTLCSFFPRYFNYGIVEITLDNAEKQYTSAVRLIRYLKISVVIVFLTITVVTILNQCKIWTIH